MENTSQENAIIASCKDLTKVYGHTVALRHLNLELPAGKIIGLLGPNGSGKTTLIKLMNDLLVPTEGQIQISGEVPGVNSKKIVSYLPERTYLAGWRKISDVLDYFQDFYEDFNRQKANIMLKDLQINPNSRMRSLSKGTKEKVQLILVMSRDAKLYILDEPIGGVDPAARTYILNTIISNYNPKATLLISTHLISEIENILDQVIFIKNGEIVLNDEVDYIRQENNQSIDQLFREVFKC